MFRLVERDLDGETRSKKERARAAKSKPVLDSFFAWCLDEQGKVFDATPISIAIGYALNQRAALSASWSMAVFLSTTTTPSVPCASS